MAKLLVPYTITWANRIFTVHWSEIYSDVTFSSNDYVFHAFNTPELTNYFTIGTPAACTTLDYTKCTSPTAASISDFETAVEALVLNEFNDTTLTGNTSIQGGVTIQNDATPSVKVVANSGVTVPVEYWVNGNIVPLTRIGGKASENNNYAFVDAGEGVPGLLLVDNIGGLYNGGSMSVQSPGLKFSNATSGYTPTGLDYYEEVTVTNNVSGPIASSAMNFKVTRVGNLVTVYIPGCRKAGNSTLSNIVFSAVVPSRFLPSSGTGVTWLSEAQIVVDNGSSVEGLIQMTISSGSLAAYASPAGTSFAATTNTVGLDACSISWVI